MASLQGLSSFGHFASPGLKLFGFGASRALEQHRAVGLHAMDATSCPPEAAKAFLSADTFVPTTASDMWQFGCLVYADRLFVCCVRLSVLRAWVVVLTYMSV